MTVHCPGGIGHGDILFPSARVRVLAFRALSVIGADVVGFEECR